MTALDADSSADIEAPSDVVFGIIADLELLPKWLPRVTIARSFEHDDDGRATLVHTELGMVIRRTGAHLRASGLESSTVTWVLEHGEVRLSEVSWTLRDLGAGRTRAEFAVRIHVDFQLGLLSRGPADDALLGTTATSTPHELNAFIVATHTAMRHGRRPAGGPQQQGRLEPSLRSRGRGPAASRAGRHRR